MDFQALMPAKDSRFSFAASAQRSILYAGWMFISLIE